jgi:hypothetical protein
MTDPTTLLTTTHTLPVPHHLCPGFQSEHRSHLFYTLFHNATKIQDWMHSAYIEANIHQSGEAGLTLPVAPNKAPFTVTVVCLRTDDEWYFRLSFFRDSVLVLSIKGPARSVDDAHRLRLALALFLLD